MSEIEHAYQGSDADKTRAVYLRLIEHGQVGDIAVNLLRTCKASERAKKYRGRSVGDAYAKKDWSISELCRALVIHADDLGIAWGWGRDEKTRGFEDVLYVDLPAGQISFHASSRRDGPGYRGQWDGVRGEGARRIIAFAESVLDGSFKPAGGDHHVERDRTQGTATPGPEGGEVRDEGQQEAFNFGPAG